MKLRIAVAKYGQETNSFSLGRTTLDTFRQFGLYQGVDVLRDGMKTGPLAGLETACQDLGVTWTPLPLIRGWGGASVEERGPGVVCRGRLSGRRRLLGRRRRLCWW